MKDGIVIQKNLSPYEVRLELLKMAKDMLVEDYYGSREKISNEWALKADIAKVHGNPIPEHPGYPAYPTEAEIIAKATALNGFVSQIPQDIKTSKKST